MGKNKTKAEDAYYKSQQEKNAAMKSYEDKFEAGEEAGQVKDYGFDIIRWEEEGQIVLGEIQGFEDFMEGEFETVCNKWLIKTDTGMVSCVLGVVADKRLKDAKTGDLIKITYKGKVALSDGRHVNRFELKVLPSDTPF